MSGKTGMEVDRTKNATRNIVFGIVLKSYQMLLPFFTKSAMIHFLGVQFLGLNGLFSSILNVLNLAELGVGGAMVYSMYRPIAEQDTETVCALMKLYRTYYRIIGAVIGCLGIAISGFLPLLIRDELPGDLNLYLLYYMNLAATVLSYWLFSYKNSLLVAHQRNDISSKIAIAVTSLRFALQMFVLCVLRSYYLFLAVVLLCQIVRNIVTAVLVSARYPQYRAQGSLDGRRVSEINGRIRDLFIGRIGGVVLNYADSIIISAFIGLTALAMYQNYYAVMASVFGLLEVILTSVTAGLGHAYLTESRGRNYRNIKSISFLFLWLIGTGSCCFIGMFQPFMRLWMGEDMLLPNTVIFWLCAYFCVYEVTRLLNIFKDAGGFWHEDRLRPLISAVLNVTLNLLTIRRFGLYGVVISTVVALGVIEIPWMLHNIFALIFERELLADYLKLLLRWAAVTVFAGGGLVLILGCIHLGRWAEFFLSGVISFGLSNIVFWLFMRGTPEFESSLALLNRMTGGKLGFLRT